MFLNKLRPFLKNYRRFSSIKTISNEIPQQLRSYGKLAFAAGTAGLFSYDYLVNDFSHTKSGLRFCRSMKTAVLISNDYYWTLRQKPEDPLYDQNLKAVHQKSADRLLEACLKNGGLFIKVGQGVAAINHMIPEEYTTTLSQLQDKCLPSTKEDVLKLFKEEFQKTPEEIYADFEYEPVAAASLAQVFKAKLKDSGEQVAVKVQYSDLEKRFHADLGTMIFLQDLVEIFFKDYNFGWILKDLKENLVQEMDFNNEGRNSEMCAKQLKKFKFVKIPKVYWDYTKKRILTMEWIDGVKITDLNALKKDHIKVADVDLKLFKTFSEQIFNTGFVHADPHPGNIFVRKNKSKEAELVILDHGLYEKIPRDVREPLCEFWEATVLRDEGKMKESAGKLGVENYEQFAEVLFQVPFKMEGGGGIKTRLTDADIQYMKEVGRKNFKKIMQTLQEMPRNLLFVIRNLNTIRAISREHGDPIDRPKVMARYAQSCLENKSNSIFGFIRWAYRRTKFEISLFKQNFKRSLVTLYLDILYKLGRSTEKSETILNPILS